jgi:C4-dicarboxylate-specific signal transduction histidine kinase
MLYVGFLEWPFVAVKYAVLAGIGAVFFAVMLLAAWWSLRAAGRIFRPLEQMTATMRRVESGDTTARVGPVMPADEIGRLATTLDHLLDVVDDKTRALQRWGDELDHKVAERTAELQAAQQQLVRSEKLAAIGQLTASIAHEINNPIAVIQGNLDLLRLTLGEAAAPVRDEIRLIDAQVERMRLIVTQLLQYARPNEYAGYVERLDAAEVVQDSLVLVRHLLERERVRLDNRCAPGAVVTVAINRQELQQVLINLMVNAVQAMAGVSDRARVLTLAMRAGEADGADGGTVCIDVTDTGPGLDEATQAALFQPFFTTKRDGNGLGLWISRGLLERYGGALRAANRAANDPAGAGAGAGPGALFTICLPADAPSTPP